MIKFPHFHDFIYINRPIGCYGFYVWRCDCGMNKIEKKDKKEKWFTDKEFDEKVKKITQQQ